MADASTQNANESKPSTIYNVDETQPCIQIVSDLHLEFGGVFDKMEEEDRFPKRGAPILALLGDIGRPQQETYWQFIDKMCDEFEHIIIITGNHEYYQNEYHSVHQLIRTKIQNNIIYKEKVHFLHNQVLELPDFLPNTRILGTTMWVNYPKADEDEKIAIEYEYRINDFRRIRINESVEDSKEEEENEKLPLLTSLNVNKFHRDAVTFLEAELNRANNDNTEVIILTHHAPTNYNCIYSETDHETNPVEYGMNYESMEYLFRSPLIGWFFGHTHCCCDFLCKSKDASIVRIAANQQGYIVGYGKDKADKRYRNNKVIVFPNDHKQNSNIPVIEFESIEKHLVNKSKLIPDPSFFGKSNVDDDISEKNDNDNHHTNHKCHVL